MAYLVPKINLRNNTLVSRRFWLLRNLWYKLPVPTPLASQKNTIRFQ